MTETVVVSGAECVTLVNVFSMKAEARPLVLDLLTESTRSVISKRAGWISTHFLVSEDGRRIIIYSQWASLADVEAMRTDPQLAPYFTQLGGLTQMDAIPCRISSIHRQ